MLSMGISSPPALSGCLSRRPAATKSLRAAFLTLSLTPAGWQVLGPVLNRSESGLSAAAPPVLDPNNSTSRGVSRPALRDFEPPHVGWGSQADLRIDASYAPLPCSLANISG